MKQDIFVYEKMQDLIKKLVLDKPLNCEYILITLGVKLWTGLNQINKRLHSNI